MKACIRVLIDTDGSIYELKLNIVCSKIYNYKTSRKTLELYITKKSELSKFYKEIGFSNPKHLNKLQPRGVVD